MPDYDQLFLFIDGEWIDRGTRDGLDVFNPATGDVIGTLPVATEADIQNALNAAEKGFHVWRQISPFERGKILRQAATLIRERSSAIAIRMSLEEGKPVAEARGEVNVAADMFDWFAEEGRRSYGRVIPSRSEGTRYLVLREPVGPTAAFSPWNFPATSPARKIAASLGAGCSCIVKPAEETPATCLAIARALADAGLPKGVLNVLYGSPEAISSQLISSPVIRKISFTGSTVVGKKLAHLAADGVKRMTLELGGHAPVVIFEDADIEKTAQLAVAAKFRNAGQVCISPTRFYVHENVHDQFVDAFIASARLLRIGSGVDPETQMGPLANPRRLAAMTRLVEDAVAVGGELRLGGHRIGNQGNFWEPTLLVDVPEHTAMMNEEPFGPIAMTSRFKTFDEAVTAANRLPFGLAAYAFTQSDKTAMAISNALESGMVGLNTFAISVPETPFGGVKESGFGSEGGIEGLDAYLATKFVSQA
ncbi:MAG: aldehyde dehydrogenase family protein [Rhizobiales bacterium]|nr:aldehyde dehydrogenase family protein [Hyphomicrobiales bacterium]